MQICTSDATSDDQPDPSAPTAPPGSTGASRARPPGLRRPPPPPATPCDPPRPARPPRNPLIDPQCRSTRPQRPPNCRFRSVTPGAGPAPAARPRRRPTAPRSPSPAGAAMAGGVLDVPSPSSHDAAKRRSPCSTPSATPSARTHRTRQRQSRRGARLPRRQQLGRRWTDTSEPRRRSPYRVVELLARRWLERRCPELETFQRSHLESASAGPLQLPPLVHQSKPWRVT